MKTLTCKLFITHVSPSQGLFELCDYLHSELKEITTTSSYYPISSIAAS